MAPEERLDSEGACDDQRGQFQRDRDRILYCSAFRRLAGVTQVVSVAEGEVFHNRLTHSIKVAQLARRLTEWLRDTTDRPLEPEVSEAAALAHDLGHAPFGHVGEAELNNCVAEYGKSSSGTNAGFEGNAQSFRIVTRLAMRREGLSGLNLTRATLNAILKYPWLREASGPRSIKWGAYHCDKKYFHFAREDAEGRDEQAPSAFIMDWADDIAYSVHDVEDFYRAGLVPLDRFHHDGAELDRFLDKSFKGERQQAEAAVVTLQKLITTPMREPYQGRDDQRGALRFFTSTLVGKLLRAVEVTDGYTGLKVNEERKWWVNVLKALMRYYVYSNPALAAQQYGQKRIVRETFQTLFDLAKSPAGGHKPRNRDVLPISIRHRFDVDSSDPVIAQGIADAVVGMTERQLVALHGRLTGARPGTVLNTIVQ